MFQETARSSTENITNEDEELARTRLSIEKRGIYGEAEEEVSPEDFEAALTAVRELRKMVESEPTTLKVMYQLGRIAHTVAYLGFAGGTMVASLIEAIHFEIRGHITGKKELDLLSLKNIKKVDAIFDVAEKKLTDAHKHWKDLKKSASRRQESIKENHIIL